jgi:hydroxyquinol 1,2-dioxygenase
MSVVEKHQEMARREEAVTEQVLASFEHAPSARTRAVLQAAVRHLHACAREVRLTEQEWQQTLAFLTRCGQISDDRRHEFVLLSDVLGLSMLTIGMNAPQEPDATEGTVFGPFFAEGAHEVAFGGDIARGHSGEPCWVEGRVTSVTGEPVASAIIDVWESDDQGFYDVQYEDGRTAGRGRTRTDANGRYGFWSVRPVAYPIPHDGPVGELLRATDRGPMRPAHIHFMVTAPGFHTLTTHVFLSDSPHLDDDAVFGVKSSLIRDLVEHRPGRGPAERTLDGRWWELVFDIRLAPTPGEDS